MKTRKSIKVEISWLLPSNGGRDVLIQGFHYRPTIIIATSSSNRHWSFILDFYSMPEYEKPTLAEGCFLADYSQEEPWGIMNCGTHFFVMEGPRHIGNGIVIENARDIDVSFLPSYQ